MISRHARRLFCLWGESRQFVLTEISPLHRLQMQTAVCLAVRPLLEIVHGNGHPTCANLIAATSTASLRRFAALDGLGRRPQLAVVAGAAHGPVVAAAYTVYKPVGFGSPDGSKEFTGIIGEWGGSAGLAGGGYGTTRRAGRGDSSRAGRGCRQGQGRRRGPGRGCRVEDRSDGRRGHGQRSRRG